MKPKLHHVLTTFMAGALISIGLTSCSGGGRQTSRKKMPTGDVTLLNPLSYTATSIDGLPFYTSDVDIQWNGSAQTFAIVSLPDPVYDSLAVSLVLNHQDYAVPLLTQWATGDRKGVVIDLRSSASQDTRREDFTLEKAGAFSIPVIFLWDALSANRAAGFMNTLHSTTSISCRRTNAQTGYDQQSCFPTNQTSK